MTKSLRPLLVLALLVGCSSKEQTPAPSGTPETGTTPVTLKSFDPKGCGYTVGRIDEFPEFEPGNDELGADPKPKHVRTGLGGAVEAGKAGYADPSTSFSVGWQTDAATKASKIKYGEAPDKLTNTADGISYFLRQEFKQGPADGIQFHEAHACGLTPGRTYYYQVGGGPAGKEVWSDVKSTTTAAAKGSKDPLVFAFAGDSRDALGRTELPVWKAIAGRIKSAGARVTVFSGDMVLAGAHQDNWEKWTTASDDLAASSLIAMAAGNHENETVRYFAHALMPGVGKNAERYSSFDQGPVHFVILDDYLGIVSHSIDTDNYKGELLAWLEKDLAAADANRANVPWIIAAHHHTSFDSGDREDRDPERKALRDTIVPLFDKYHLDVDLQGHNHFYERSKSIAGGKAVTAPEKGTTYVVCAAAGAPEYGTKDGNALSEKIVHYKPDAGEGIYGIAKAEPTKLTLSVYKMNGPGGTGPADDTKVDELTLTR